MLENDSLAEGVMTVADANGVNILLAKVDGRIYAIEAVCSHKGGELWNGKLTGPIVKCPKHGAEYDVRTGAVVNQVRIPLIGKAKNQRTVQVSVDGDGVFVDV